MATAHHHRGPPSKASPPAKTRHPTRLHQDPPFRINETISSRRNGTGTAPGTRRAALIWPGVMSPRLIPRGIKRPRVIIRARRPCPPADEVAGARLGTWCQDGEKRERKTFILFITTGCLKNILTYVITWCIVFSNIIEMISMHSIFLFFNFPLLFLPLSFNLTPNI